MKYLAEKLALGRFDFRSVRLAIDENAIAAAPRRRFRLRRPIFHFLVESCRVGASKRVNLLLIYVKAESRHRRHALRPSRCCNSLVLFDKGEEEN